MPRFKLFDRDREFVPVRQGAISGALEVLYIALVALFMVGTQSFLRDSEPSPWLNVFGIVCMLSLLVLSVGMSGLFVFGWPAHYVMEKKYEEALSAFLSTVATIFIIFAALFVGASLLSYFR